MEIGEWVYLILNIDSYYLSIQNAFGSASAILMTRNIVVWIIPGQICEFISKLKTNYSSESQDLLLSEDSKSQCCLFSVYHVLLTVNLHYACYWSNVKNYKILRTLRMNVQRIPTLSIDEQQSNTLSSLLQSLIFYNKMWNRFCKELYSPKHAFEEFFL